MAGKKSYKAVEWTGHRGRYVIIDTESGEVLDDAQGYGYRTPQKAYAGYGWKSRSESAKEKERKVKAWMGKNKRIVNQIDDAAFCRWKDSDGHESLKARDVRQILKAASIDEKELGFTAGDLLRTCMR